MLDVLAEYAAELSGKLDEHRRETAMGFDRVDRRFGRLETRVEVIENDLLEFRAEFEKRVAPLER